MPNGFRIIVAKIEWMEHYDGEEIPDPTHDFTRDNRYGAEQFNFSANTDDEYVLGYAPHKKGISIERIDENATDRDELEDVLIVWVAKKPRQTGVVVVGWYENGTVLRNFSKDQMYQFETRKENAILLRPTDRRIRVPIGRGVMGSQAAIWYADKDNDETKDFVKRIRTLVDAYREERTREMESNAFQSGSAEDKAVIEKKAIDTTREYFESKNYTVISVESENLGYDLLAVKPHSKLCIEVKGRTMTEHTTTVVVNLTPNEFQFMNRNKSGYRLAIVRISSEKDPVICLCKYSNRNSRWILEGSNTITVNVTRVTGGKVTLQ